MITKQNINIILFLIIGIIIIYIMYNQNGLFEKMTNTSEDYIIIKRNNKLIKEFNFFMEDLQYYLNRDNELYVKNTNKNYGTYILNMQRYRDYYKNRFLLMIYPIKIRKSNNNYYIDYNFNGIIIPNKIFDEEWFDFQDSYPNIWGFNNPQNYIKNSNLKNFPSKAIITIYSTNSDVYDTVKSILQSYHNYEIQICQDKLDLILNKVLSMNKISELLGDKLYNSLLNGELDYITNISDKIGVVDINSILNSNQFNEILQSEQLNSDNAQITIETRNDKYVFIYNIKEQSQKADLIELLDYIQTPADTNLTTYNKKLKFTKLPINPYRILILLKNYNMI